MAKPPVTRKMLSIIVKVLDEKEKTKGCGGTKPSVDAVPNHTPFPPQQDNCNERSP